MNTVFNQPLRSGDTTRRDWQRINQLAADGKYGRYETINLRDKVTEMDRMGLDDGYFYPLKIYSFPSCWRANANISADWLKFRVHAGRYQGIKVLNTDVHDTNHGDTNYPSFPDDDIPIDEGDVADIAIPVNTQQYWFWIDVSSPNTPTLKSGFSGQSVSGNIGDPSGLGWATFPVPDSNHIPLGWVDTKFDAANHHAVTRQLVRSDVSATGGGGAVVREFNYLKSFGDYVIGVDFANGNTHVAIAKQYKLRNSIPNTWIYGTLWSYTYPKNPANWDTVNSYSSPNIYAFMYRTASSGNISQNEGIVPQFIPADPNTSPVQVADKIWAIQTSTDVKTVPADPDNTPNSAVNWLMLQDSRAWAKFADQSF